jgi:hypothetical protein
MVSNEYTAHSWLHAGKHTRLNRKVGQVFTTLFHPKRDRFAVFYLFLPRENAQTSYFAAFPVSFASAHAVGRGSCLWRNVSRESIVLRFRRGVYGLLQKQPAFH